MSGTRVADPHPHVRLVTDADVVIPLAGMPPCASDCIGAVAINRDAVIARLPSPSFPGASFFGDLRGPVPPPAP
jgi:hypothetical protein